MLVWFFCSSRFLHRLGWIRLHPWVASKRQYKFLTKSERHPDSISFKLDPKTLCGAVPDEFLVQSSKAVPCIWRAAMACAQVGIGCKR